MITDRGSSVPAPPWNRLRVRQRMRSHWKNARLRAQPSLRPEWGAPPLLGARYHLTTGDGAWPERDLCWQISQRREGPIRGFFLDVSVWRMISGGFRPQLKQNLGHLFQK